MKKERARKEYAVCSDGFPIVVGEVEEVAEYMGISTSAVYANVSNMKNRVTKYKDGTEKNYKYEWFVFPAEVKWKQRRNLTSM